MRRSSVASVPGVYDFVSAPSSIRPGQYWQFSADNGAPPYTFSETLGSVGTITAGGRYTASHTLYDASNIRVTDNTSATKDKAVSLYTPFFTLTNQVFQMTAEPSGMIIDSGGTMAEYTTDEYAAFLIRGDDHNSPITFQFYSIDTEGGYDSLNVYDGYDGGVLLGTFSGNSLPGSVTATSGNMLLVWHSDSGAPNGNFLAYWYTTPASLSIVSRDIYALDVNSDETLTAHGGVGPFTFSVVSGGGSFTPSATDASSAVFHTPLTAGTTTVRVTDALNNTVDRTYVVAEAFNLCAGSASSLSNGVLYDHGGPTGSYAEFRTCGFLVNGSPGNPITLKMDYVATEGGYDIVTVYDGINDSGTLIGTYSGNFATTSTMTATSGNMYIKFVADGDPGYLGFRAIWNQ